MATSTAPGGIHWTSCHDASTRGMSVGVMPADDPEWNVRRDWPGAR